MTETDQITPQVTLRDKVARDLSAIEDLVVHLEAEAIDLASDRLMPGGHAMVALGPEADLDEWAEQIAALEFRHYALGRDGTPVCSKTDHRRCHVADHLLDEDDQDHEPPLQTLLYWSEAWRDERGFPLDGRRPTLTSETSFIRNSLDWAWDNEIHFEDFARDINRTRRVLESLLHAGRRPDRTRVPCPDCEHKPRLIKIRSGRYPVGFRCRVCATRVGPESENQGHCPNPSCWTPLAPEPAEWSSDPNLDRHKCPSCKRRFDKDAFNDAYAKHLRSEGAARYVRQIEAIATLEAVGRSRRTIYTWLEPPRRHVADRCPKCRRHWKAGQQEKCPGTVLVDGIKKACEAQLIAVVRGNGEDVIEGYCEIGTIDVDGRYSRTNTRAVWLWWPDLWRRHLLTRAVSTRPRRSSDGAA